MLKRIAFLGLVLALVAPVQAQTGKPYVKFPQTKESLARAIEYGKDGDERVLNVTAADFVAEMNETYGLRLENREDLANHIRSMEVVALPVDRDIHFGRLVGSKPDSKGWNRKAHPNEQGLKNNETQRIELSLWCANPTPGLLLAPIVARAPKKVEAPMVVTPAPVQTFVLRIENPQPEPKPIIRNSHLDRNWGWYALATGVVAGLVVNNNRQWFSRDGNITNILTNTNR